jgi:hypothetical protein
LKPLLEPVNQKHKAPTYISMNSKMKLLALPCAFAFSLNFSLANDFINQFEMQRMKDEAWRQEAELRHQKQQMEFQRMEMESLRRKQQIQLDQLEEETRQATREIQEQREAIEAAAFEIALQKQSKKDESVIVEIENILKSGGRLNDDGLRWVKETKELAKKYPEYRIYLTRLNQVDQIETDLRIEDLKIQEAAKKAQEEEERRIRIENMRELRDFEEKRNQEIALKESNFKRDIELKLSRNPFSLDQIDLPILLVANREFRLLNSSGSEISINPKTPIHIKERSPTGLLHIRVNGVELIGAENRLAGNVGLDYARQYGPTKK